MLCALLLMLCGMNKVIEIENDSLDVMWYKATD